MEAVKQSLLTLAVVAQSGLSQGIVNFANETGILSSPPDRLVRFASAATPGNPFGTNGAPVVGTNFWAQLYYGASTSPESSLIPVSEQPARLRPSTTANPGAWTLGGLRTLEGFAIGETVTLQVRVWDFFDGTTYEAALANNPAGLSGVSLPFSYTIQPDLPPATWVMKNFQGFSLPVPEPGQLSLLSLGAFGWLGRAWLARRNPP